MGRFRIGMRYLLGALTLSLFVMNAAVYGAAVSPAPMPPAAPAAQAPAAAPEDFHYGGALRRDPFKSLLVLQEKKRDVSMLPPIQQVDLQTFKVVGVIQDQMAGNRAMVQGPDGKTYVIKKGDIIGKNEGEIMDISLSGISVRERFLDFMNKETIVNTVLRVSEKQK